MISEVDCYIRTYSGIGHCLLAQTIGDLFSIVLQSGAFIGALPRLFPFPRGSSFSRTLFSLSWKQAFHHVFKRREYHVDYRTKKAALFFVACDTNPDTRVKIPNAMRITGYSPSKTADRSLQQQVRREVDKIIG